MVTFRNCRNQVGIECVGCGMLFLSFITARIHEDHCPKELADAKASKQQPPKPGSSAYEQLEAEHKPGQSGPQAPARGIGDGPTARPDADQQV